ncbi:hypothetical protein FPSE_11880 [Fusarium pseudograminearum CS3096]|uniref:Uncharacterized protein n=1 Tax=Fusarium pseudograminearum (strain CS3096) TaxID=1028729 RepID=K3V549_FUSPC|nr:hypothetical protein FPSE_11880 [Fusarium pseudograminearum CS3096]EKJ68069.1 hypothetical protein FPSE_11880 [Fusarium pseudograminearum CS3096]
MDDPLHLNQRGFIVPHPPPSPPPEEEKDKVKTKREFAPVVKLEFKSVSSTA